MSGTTETTPPAPEAAPEQAPRSDAAGSSRLQAWIPSVTVTLLAVVLALLIGAVLTALSDDDVLEALGYVGSYPGDFFSRAGSTVWDSYSALVTGSVGSGNAISATLERAAPLICAGLGVTLAFRAGLFNIGAQGQIVMGAIVAGWIGFSWHLPAGLHLLVAVVGGVLGGAVWGGIVGFLKARTGAHEVITTIMFNYLAASVLLYALSKDAFQRPGSDNSLSPKVDDTAVFPDIRIGFLGLDFHSGVILALLAAVGIWWLLERSTTGFEMRAVGANADAARTAGMNVAKVFTLVMVVAGGAAGLAAVMNVNGHHDALSPSLSGSIGFDAITVALLGRATPLGTVLAGLLFGAMSVGGVAMQSSAGTPNDLTAVLQALIVLFVAAPALVKGIVRMKESGGGATVMAKGWGS